MHFGGLGSQAAADRKKAELEANQKQRDPAAVDNGKVLQKMMRMMLKQQREHKAERLADQKQLEELRKELTELRRDKTAAAMEIKWPTGMSAQERVDRVTLCISLYEVVVTKRMVQARYKVAVKNVHPDLHPELGDTPFIDLKAARDRMLELAV